MNQGRFGGHFSSSMIEVPLLLRFDRELVILFIVFFKQLVLQDQILIDFWRHHRRCRRRRYEMGLPSIQNTCATF